MNKIILRTIYLMLFSIINVNTFAATLNSFLVQSQFITNGNVVANGNPTNILFDFSILRALDQNGNYEDVNWTITLVVKNNFNGDQILISRPITVTSADFNGTATCFKTGISAILPANKYYANGTYSVGQNTILLRYSAFDYTNSITLQPTSSATTYPVDYQYLGYNPYPAFNNGNTVFYDGISVPFVNRYGTSRSFNWSMYDQTDSNGNGNIPGTIINFDDNIPVLIPTQSIFSPNGLYRLTLQTDGNLVLYQENSGNERGLWSTRTNGKTAGSLFFQTDGHLVLYSGSTQYPSTSSIWYSDLYDTNGSITRFAQSGVIMSYPFYKLQDDGNLVFYWPNGVGDFNPPVPQPNAIRIIYGATDSGINQRYSSSPVSPHPTTLIVPVSPYQSNNGAFGSINSSRFRTH